MELSNSTNKKGKNWISKSIARDSSSNTMMMMINNKTSITTSTSPNNHSFNSQIIGYEDQDDYMINNAFSWPPRSYTCSFCKREFRSAQALGGHMNVHRKDRARLRQSPPSDILINSRHSNTTTFLNLNLNQNPNPNFPASTTTTLNITTNISQPALSSSTDQTKKCQTHELDHHDHHVQYPLMTNIMNSKVLREGFEGKKDVSYHNFKSLKSIKIGDEKTKTTVRLDLEIGLLCDLNSESIGRDLDLELRLGYSN